MGSRHLTIIGAGPKAVAIAAKAKVLADLGQVVPEICVLEPAGICAHWSGRHGYTDGKLPLGTSPEKDVGFPYASQGWGAGLNREIDERMLRYSWQAFHVLDRGRSYAEWIDRLRPNPRHAHWAEYLQWVGNEVGMRTTEAHPETIDVEDGRWQLTLSSGESLESDGLVVTSPGPPRKSIEVRGSSTWLLDGHNFWLEENKRAIEQRVSERRSLSACVIGSGETAAAVVVELERILDDDSSIAVISKEGIVYTRGESYEENRLYSNPELWTPFPEKVRKEFVKRTDRGVFSVGNKAVLNRAERVTTLAGEVAAIEADGDALTLEFRAQLPKQPYDLVVDATGFEADWFLRLMSADARQALEAAAPDSLDAHIGRDLSVEDLSPPLHLPMSSAFRQGPGFPNLSCLGLLADRILQRHTETNEHAPGSNKENGAAAGRV